MHRRLLLAGIVGFVFAPFARAQPQPKAPLLAVILAAPVDGPFATALKQGLRDHGYVEGKTLRIELRSTQGRPERLPAIAEEIVRINPQVIVAGGGGPSARAVKQLTSTIPIVVPATANPVADGLVDSLARPGGNVTGMSIVSEQINAKRIQFAKELLPNAKHIGLLADPEMGAMNAEAAVVASERGARSFGLRLHVFRASKPEEFAAVFQTIKRSAVEALIVSASSTYNVHRQSLIDLAAENRLPVVWEHRQFPASGGLLSYGPDITDLYRNAARYVDKILKGAKPAELPVEQATKFEFVVNLKTAQAQGISIPSTLLLRADEVIR